MRNVHLSLVFVVTVIILVFTHTFKLIVVFIEIFYKNSYDKTSYMVHFAMLGNCIFES
jgi:hypothetical protein